MSDIKFPTEIISLPSGGKYYTEDNPLSSGQIEIKYPTAKEEDILTSINLIKRGIVIDRLLESLIVDKNIKLDTILIGDKNAIMVAARILAYGKNYVYEYDCPACGEHNDNCTIDLTTFDNVKINDTDFSFTLPVSKRNIKFKFLTHADETRINKIIESTKRITKISGITADITTRMKQIIIEIDGSTKQQDINHFVDNEFLSQDSLAFREYLQSIIPDIDMTGQFECELCGWKEDIVVPMSVQFFWPKARK